MIPLPLKRLVSRFLERSVARAARRAAEEAVAPLAASLSLEGRRTARLEAQLADQRKEIARVVAALAGTDARLAEALRRTDADRARAESLETRLISLGDELAGRHDRCERDLAGAVLAARYACLHPPGDDLPPAPRPDPTLLLPPSALQATLAALAPAAFPAWQAALDAGRIAYAGTPTDSCSVEGHAVAGMFRRYLAPLLRGNVLDIGCGVQTRPFYLHDWPDRHIAAADPLEPAAPHPFIYARSVAEFLPWPDGSFDLAVAATSLDHVLHPERAFRECARVIKPGGRLVVWEWIAERAAPYDPVAGPVEPPDAFHLFNFDMESFTRASRACFELEDIFALLPGRSHFLTLRRLDRSFPV